MEEEGHLCGIDEPLPAVRFERDREGRPMRVAVLSPFVPFEGIDHAGGQFVLHWARSLSDHGLDVTVIAPDWVAFGARKAGGSEEPFGILEVPVPGSELARRLGTKLTTIFLTPGWGITKAMARNSAVHREIERADLVEVQFSQFLPVGKALGSHGKPSVAIAHDIITESARRRFLGAATARDRVLAAVRWPVFRWEEPRLLNSFTGILSFSALDVITLQRMGVKQPVRIIAPWLERVADPRGPASEPVVLMVGHFGRAENHDGAAWFLLNCWPRVRRAVPGARLVLAGAGSSLDLCGPDVTVTGWLESLEPCYRRAAVVIAPLLSGAGLKFKVAQAMAHGLPVVATTVAADGYREAGGREAFVDVSDDPTRFADSVVACLLDTHKGREVGSLAANWVAEVFDWDRSVNETIEWYRSLVGVTEV